MPRFFCDAIAGGKAVITGEDAAHIARSLRMAARRAPDPLGRAGHRF